MCRCAPCSIPDTKAIAALDYINIVYRVGRNWNILFYSKTIENILKKLCKIINGIGEDVLVFYFHVFGVTKGHPVEEVVKIFIQAYVE